MGRKVLELGCGIGNVLKHFSKFDCYGLDIKKEYIEKCRKRIKGEFFVQSMHNFKIDEKFDCIFSVYDSINFLKGFEKIF